MHLSSSHQRATATIEPTTLEGIVIDVDATPEPDLQMRVAHRMVNQDVGDVSSDGRLGLVPTGTKA